MPVKRQKIEIRSNLSTGSGVISPPTPAALSTIGQISGDMARRAGEISKVMAGIAEKEGIALAKAAVFSEDQYGLPIMPQDISDKMGRIANEAYDGVMEERFVHQMTTAVGAQLNDASIANQYDLEGFVADAQSRIDAMAETVPEEFRGAFQQVATGLMADHGARVGRAQAQVVRRDMGTQNVNMVEQMNNQVFEQFASGNDDRGRMMVNQTIEMIQKMSPATTSAADKQKLIEQTLANSALARLAALQKK